MAGKKALKFRNLLTPKQPGELARLRVLAGPDSGSIFVMMASKVTIGRDNNNDIILSDLKASRNHAEVSVVSGFSEVKDIGSTHGVAVNGVALKQAQIKSGDKIGVGETVFEFIGSEMGATKFINTIPGQTASKVGTGSSGFTQFIPRPVSGSVSGSVTGTVNRPANTSVAGGTSSQSFFEKNRKLMVMLGALMLVATLLPEVEKKQKAKRAGYKEPTEVAAERGISSINPPPTDDNTKQASDLHFKEGFREYRAKNYSRARISFETALQIYPAHPMAHVYLEMTKKTMEDEAKTLIGNAQKDEEALRYSVARTKYNAVKRMYGREPSSEHYKEADKRVGELDKKIKEMK